MPVIIPSYDPSFANFISRSWFSAVIFSRTVPLKKRWPRFLREAETLFIQNSCL